MVRDLKVLHCNQKSLGDLDHPWFNWKTCLRQIAIGHADWNSPAMTESLQVYSGNEAYRFLIEVGCGLHSPMVGETEVFGQFRKLLTEVQSSENHSHEWLAQLLDKARLEIKKIRTQHLVGLGSQSYGSLIRKKTKSFKGVSFVGSGHLTVEILPWLAKHPGGVNIYVRDIEKYQELSKNFGFARWLKLDDPEHLAEMKDSLVVCAPLESEKIQSLIDASGQNVQKVFDLRGESKTDPLSDRQPVEDLEQLFSQIARNRQIVEEKVSAAKADIIEIARKF
tara:strand:+ start:96129 stop:96968 length:840 start_codon:yes stop_codon:yes gene_type:complete